MRISRLLSGLSWWLGALIPLLALSMNASSACQHTGAGRTRATNLLANPGFEGEWTRDTVYWTPDGGPYHTPFGEIFTPEGWVTWWREGFPCSDNDDFNAGRPEVKVINLGAEPPFPDPLRMHSGDQAAQLFTFWQCHQMGLVQEVEVEKGAYYNLAAYGHAWYSWCSEKPHSPPLHDDCKTRINPWWAQDWLQIGLGVGFDLEGVTWSDPVEVYGEYDEPLELGPVRATSDTMTVWLKADATQPLKHNDVYWDDVSLERAYLKVYLPLLSVP